MPSASYTMAQRSWGMFPSLATILRSQIATAILTTLTCGMLPTLMYDFLPALNFKPAFLEHKTGLLEKVQGFKTLLPMHLFSNDHRDPGH